MAHMLVKVYTGKGYPLAANIPLGRLAELCKTAVYRGVYRASRDLEGSTLRSISF
jgi:hypothetical protein